MHGTYIKINDIGFYIIEKDNKLYYLSTTKPLDYIEKRTPLINKTIHQLQEYFNHQRTTFDIPVYLEGTDFQIQVWKALMQIPYGKTISYKKLATMIGNPKASRAVGNANNKNKIMIIIPCHRVIGANGKLVGYAGGLELKQMLLDIENPSH